MLFNSIDFAVFLPLVFLLYWFVVNNNLKLQNALLLVASYVFYGWWDWRFLSLIALSSLLDYFIGIGLSNTDHQKKRRLLLLVSISFNLGLLGFFKYYNFFLQSFVDAFSFFGYHIHQTKGLSIILPVGISFYTFQTLSYTIDVYKRKLAPTKDIIAFFTFVSFFPQLVAGPIERASNLLPQFYKHRSFEQANAIDGLRQILWGLFKKIAIADFCAVYANIIFNNYNDYSGVILLIGATFFAFQIYGDFSGYSDIAIGTAKLFGFDLKQNFAFPYFSRDIAEFWRRWHISLSTWFRDYVYIPLGGSRGSRFMQIRNIFVIFIVSGFWHGANWTFLAWGAVNAIYFLPLMLLNKNRVNTNVVAEGKSWPNLKELVQIIFTFFITVIAWVFFRANSIGDAYTYLSKIFSATFFDNMILYLKKISDGYQMGYCMILLFVFIIVEWIQRDKQHALQLTGESNILTKFAKYKVLRWLLYYAILIAIAWFNGQEQMFIYFQF